MSECVCVCVFVACVGLFLFSFMLFKCFIKIAYDHGWGRCWGLWADRPLSASSLNNNKKRRRSRRRRGKKYLADTYERKYPKGRQSKA